MPPQPGHKGDSAVRNYNDDGRDPDRMWSEGILSTHLPLKNPFPQSTCGKNLRQTPTEKQSSKSLTAPLRAVKVI